MLNMRLVIRILPPPRHLLKRLCIRGTRVLGLELVDLVFHVGVVLCCLGFGFDDRLLVLFVVVGWDCCVHFCWWCFEYEWLSGGWVVVVVRRYGIWFCFVI